MSKVQTWDRSKGNKKQTKRSNGSSKPSESFKKPSMDKLRKQIKKRGAK